jgi:hypothetical protein
MFQRLIGFASQGAATQIMNDATSEPTGAKIVLDPGYDCLWFSGYPHFDQGVRRLRL